MSTSQSPASPPLATLPIAELERHCAEEQARYRRDPAPQESAGCLEIVRRAAARDKAAFAALLPLIALTIRRRHRTAPPDAREELQQEVAMRLFQRLYYGEPPFQVTHFPAFMAYLALTCSSTLKTLAARRSTAESLEALREATGYEPPAPLPSDAVERRMRLERYLELLPTPAHRETFRRRFALGQPPAEIAETMGLTRSEVYRLIEQAVRLLAALPEVREMLEA